MGRFDPPKEPSDPALAQIREAIATLAQNMERLSMPPPQVSLPAPEVSVSPTPVNVEVPTQGIVDAVSRAVADALAALPEPETPQISLEGVTADVDLMPLVEAAQDQRAVLEALQEKLSNLTAGRSSHFDGRLRTNQGLISITNPLHITPVPVDPEHEADTGAGNDKSFTVPAGEMWRLLWGYTEYTTSGTAGNREVRFEITNVSGPLWRVQALNTQGASETQDYHFSSSIAEPTDTKAGQQYLPLPAMCLLKAGDIIRVYDAADVDAADVLAVEFVIQKYQT